MARAALSSTHGMRSRNARSLGGLERHVSVFPDSRVVGSNTRAHAHGVATDLTAARSFVSPLARGRKQMPVYLPIKPKERLYQEIVDQIQQQILSGALKPGDQIPAERDLAERFGVSRTAVREAIKSLTEKGLIEVFVG